MNRLYSDVTLEEAITSWLSSGGPDIIKFLEALMVGPKTPNLGGALSLENMPIACFRHKNVFYHF